MVQFVPGGAEVAENVGESEESEDEEWNYFRVKPTEQATDSEVRILIEVFGALLCIPTEKPLVKDLFFVKMCV